MIHTLAHVLIKELTLTCGYGSASLRERLYCNLENPAAPMNGLLIYTASGDSEGTLGGLVAQAQSGRFERLVEEALRRSSWCSNDPVCMESPGRGRFRPILRRATAAFSCLRRAARKATGCLTAAFWLARLTTPIWASSRERP